MEDDQGPNTMSTLERTHRLSVLDMVLWHEGGRDWSNGRWFILLLANMGGLAISMATAPKGTPTAMWTAGTSVLIILLFVLNLLGTRRTLRAHRLERLGQDPNSSINALLRDYDPLDVAAFKRLQSAVEKSGRLSSRALRRWVRAEKKTIWSHEMQPPTWSFATREEGSCGSPF